MSKSESDPPPATQSQGASSRVYSWVILFHFDENNEFPFSSVLLDNFKDSNFPFSVITGHLGLSDRLKPREFSRLPGPKYAVFAKVEQGKPIVVYCHTANKCF